MGPGAEAEQAQADAVKAMGGTAIRANGALDLHRLENLTGISGVLWWGDQDTARRIEQHLARRVGPIIPLIPGQPDRARVLGERHVCVDTTAAGRQRRAFWEVRHSRALTPDSEKPSVAPCFRSAIITLRGVLRLLSMS